MEVFINDIIKEDLDPLPVRRGADQNGQPNKLALEFPGVAPDKNDIVGYIPRKEYLDFLDKYVPLEDFLKQKSELVQADSTLIAILIEYPSDHLYKYKTMMLLKDEVFEPGTPMHVIQNFMSIRPLERTDNESLWTRLNEDEELVKKLEIMGTKIIKKFETGYKR